MKLFLLLVICACQVADLCLADRSFTVDYDSNSFLKDGKPFRYLSASFHYARTPSGLWKDRMLKLKAMGLNAIQTVIPWNWHQPYYAAPQSTRWGGDQNLAAFIDLAKSLDLLVLLRPGPYICAEWENGGFPAWLTNNRTMKLRSSDPGYLKEVAAWMDQLLPFIQPRLYANGGPVIMVQVENEYGSFGCDHVYIDFLYNLFRKHLGNDVVIYSTDGPTTNMVTCGSSKDIFTTIDFGVGSDPTSMFKVLREYQPKGPLVNSEFYTGWLDHWGQPHSHVSTAGIVTSLHKLLDIPNTSVSMYMGEGGTNFGFWNGANSPKYSPQPTSYDYDAPLTESGRYHPEKFTAIRDVLSTAFNFTPPDMPVIADAQAYGSVKFTEECSLSTAASKAMIPAYFDQPQLFSAVAQAFGFLLYKVEMTAKDQAAAAVHLSFSGLLHDRTVVMVNDVHQGVLERQDSGRQNVTVQKPAGITFTLALLVENQGRINYGSQIADEKGFTGTVTSSSASVSGKWVHYPMSLDDSMTSVDFFPKTPLSSAGPPSFYYSSFNVDTIGDTFLYTNSLGKGNVFINGFNLGRYWNIGPQVALYVPSVALAKGANSLVIFELDQQVTGSTEVMFKDIPDVGAASHVEVTDFRRRG